MKQVTIQFTYDDERLEALRIYLADNGSTIEDELTSALDAVYKKTVPSQVRTFLDKRSQSEPTKPKSMHRRLQNGSSRSELRIPLPAIGSLTLQKSMRDTV